MRALINFFRQLSPFSSSDRYGDIRTSATGGGYNQVETNTKRN